MPIFDEVTERVTANRAASITGTIKGFSVLGAGTALAKNVVGTLAPQAAGPLAKALRGDLVGAGLSALDQTSVGRAINGALHGTLGSDLLFNALPNPLLGGITPFEAAQIVTEMQSTAYAKKNLYFIEIVDYDPRVGGAGTSSGLFNLFCTSVSIGGGNLTGESHSIGSGAMDSLTGAERDEIRLTTLDDASGSIKRWFNLRKALAVKADGTFGVPADYLVQIRILHAAINDDVMARYGGYEEKFIMRGVSIETELSRAEDGLEEVQLSFSQFDTFMFNQ